MKIPKTFGDRALEFYRTLAAPQLSRSDILCLNPYANWSDDLYLVKFLRKFYNDNNKRILVFGINPGRLGGGSTGVSFTDPVALEQFCGIPNGLPKRRELSSEFIYQFAFLWANPQKLFEGFFLTAVCPFGLMKDGKNFNFYDSSYLYEQLRAFIVGSIRDQIAFGSASKVAIVLGSGKNAEIFRQLNAEFHFFENMLVLEHPRFIMQYRRRQLDQYLAKYLSVFRRALDQGI